MNAPRQQLTQQERERQRLAAVVGRVFVMQPPKTRDALRHAAYSKFVGREITTSDELTDAEVKRMLEKWERFDIPFSPNDDCMRECAALAVAYQKDAGQLEMFDGGA